MTATLKTFTATIHHLGFYWPAEQDEYAKSVLSFESDREGEVLPEIAFDLTNNPSKNPVYLFRSSRAYSLSVGDIVEIRENEKKEKKYWLCVSAGWLEVRRSEISYLAGKVEQAVESYGGRWEVGFYGPEAIMRRRERQDRKLAGKGAGVHAETE